MTNDFPTKQEALDYDKDISEKQRYYSLLVRELQDLKEMQDPPRQSTVDQCLRRVHETWTELARAELEHVGGMLDGVDEDELLEENYQEYGDLQERRKKLERKIEFIDDLQNKAFK